MALRLGEAGAVQIVVSRQVLAELERTLRNKAPHALAPLAVLLDQLRVEVAPEPGQEVLATCRGLVGRPGDAMILASSAGAENVASFDRDFQRLASRIGATPRVVHFKA